MVSQMPPPPCEATIRHARKVLQDAAHDQAPQCQAKIERPSDAGRETIVSHPLLAEAEMRRMDHHRHVELLHQLPKRARLVVVRIVALVAGMNENALEAELSDSALGFLDEGRAAAGQDRRKRIERAQVFLLKLGRVVGPFLDRRQFFVIGFATQIVRGIRHHADVDAVLVVGLEEILEHHGAAALAPLRPVLAVQGAEIISRLFRSIDVRVPVDDHAWSCRVRTPSRAM
jgi:hypothetical protein